MSEAVIVAATRTPIGRANKGSLVECRPDDLSAAGASARAARRRSRRSTRPRSRTSSGAARSRRARPGTTSPASSGSSPGSRTRRVRRSTGTARRRCRRSGWPPTRSGPARATCSSPGASRRSAGSRRACPTGCRARTTRRSRTPRPAPPSATRAGRGDWTPSDGPPRRLHRDGPDRRERRRVREHVTREEMDEFASRSQHRAVEAQKNGFFEREITPVTHPGRHRRCRSTTVPAPTRPLEKLASLKPVFRPDGTVTAGNACPLNDGAAVTIVMSEDRAPRARRRAARPGGGVAG